ncbi:MAG: Eco57I restriction-modification methylase domain-containing protein, partial [Kineosporiaceae bacterium]
TMTAFTTVRAVGPMLPADLLARIVDSKDLPGLTGDDYHLDSGETLRSAASRAWVRLAAAWANVTAALDRAPETDPATRLTRDKWLHVLFAELGYGRLPAVPSPGVVLGDEVLPVSHVWEAVPVHMVGARVGLDTRPATRTGRRSSPHALVQDYLNRTDTALWGFVTNGLVLRVLRDSTSLVRSAYVEFDLQAMFDGEAFADFVLLFLLCHVSRVEAADPTRCWLERWRQETVVSGTRALNALRGGVEQALRTLGSGFLRPGLNRPLRMALASGELTTGRYYQLLLRLVYQVLFLFVAEDRGVLIPGGTPPEAVGRYRDYFCTRRLRGLARRRLGTRHTDMWQSLLVVLRGLGRDEGLPELGLPPLGGLFAPGTLGPLADAVLTNADLMAAIRSLSLIPDVSGTPRSVDYRNLGAEELGSVYEALLEYLPAYDASTGEFELQHLAGNERKTTGSYYTPSSLIDSLLDSALEPLLDEAMDADDPERALLEVTVCDPACGSGHFLVAAARRIARRLAHVRTGEVEPAPEPLWHAMRDVVGRCLYGVDVNELAAELAKVSLWLEALDPGYPLSFLDPHIKVGNSLLGATPSLLAGGLPDDAFKPLGGDDRAMARVLTRRNKAERAQPGQLDLPFLEGLGNAQLAEQARAVVAIDDSTVDGVRRRAETWRALDSSDELGRARLVADAWCAAFTWRMRPGGPAAVTTRVVSRLGQGLDVPATTIAEVQRLAREHRFFHWHLEFPEIFQVRSNLSSAESAHGWDGGFTCVLGNPPWERIKLQEQEFFAARDPDIAQAPNAAARRRMIAALARTRPELHAEFEEAKRRAEGESLFLRASGRYPLNGRGDINTYAVFAEATRNLIDAHGRMGIILPTGIATDATTQHYFRDLVRSAALVSLYDFENSKPLFEGVHRSFKFCLLTVGGRGQRESAADFAFFLHDPLELRQPDVRFALKPDEIELLNPNTGTCPIFRSRRDAEITLKAYRKLPVLVRQDSPYGNLWGVSLMQM